MASAQGLFIYSKMEKLLSLFKAVKFLHKAEKVTNPHLFLFLKMNMGGYKTGHKIYLFTVILSRV